MCERGPGFPGFVAILLMALVVGVLGPAGAGDPDNDKPPTSYRPLPTGFDFPASQDELLKFAAEGDLAGARRHGWHLWAGINQPVGGDPDGARVWQTWFSYAQAFAPEAIPDPASSRSPRVARDLRRLNRQHSAGDQGSSGVGTPVYPPTCEFTGLELVNNGDIMVAKMIYDWGAYQHIRQRRLWDPATLDALVKWGRPSSIAAFPRQSVVLKHMEWPVAQDQLTALPVWDNTPVKDPNGYNGYETWPRAVAIDATGSYGHPTADVTFLYGVEQTAEGGGTKPLSPVRFLGARVVGLDKFYARKIDAAAWARMDSEDQCIVNQAARWAYNRDFRPGDYLVTVACHIITKEIPNWAMQTFWWHDEPEKGLFAEDKPADLPPGPWRNYLQTTSYDMELPREYDTSSRVAYNPYIELAAQHPIATNCQSCHGRAAWAAANTRPPVQPNYQNRGHVKEKALESVVQLDFLWSVQQGAQANAPASLK